MRERRARVRTAREAASPRPICDMDRQKCDVKAETFVAQDSRSASGWEDTIRWGWSGKVMRVTGERRESAGSPYHSEARFERGAWQDDACCNRI